jgi:hypothetical protein
MFHVFLLKRLEAGQALAARIRSIRSGASERLATASGITGGPS